MILSLLAGYALASSTISPVDFHLSGVEPDGGIVAQSQRYSDANVDTNLQRHALPIARGFGKNIPLAFAIRQIVPPSLKITLAKSIDGAQTVDWSGGKPWPNTLHDLVHPLGLRFVTQGKTVEFFSQE